MIVTGSQLTNQGEFNCFLASRRRILGARHRTPATILVVERNDFLRRTLRWWLKTKFPAYYVVEAATGEEAVDLAQSNLLRLAILDIPSPEQGNEVVARLKAVAPLVKIVILTFREDEIDYAGSKSNGVSAYISHEKIQTNLQPTLTRLLSPSIEPGESGG